MGNSVYYIAYGMLGASALAVVQVASTVNDLFQILFFGIGNASAVMIGNELGRRNEDKAYSYAVVFLKMTFAINLVMSVALFLSRGMVINIYDFDQETNIMLEHPGSLRYLYAAKDVYLCFVLRYSALGWRYSFLYAARPFGRLGHRCSGGIFGCAGLSSASAYHRCDGIL